MKKITCMLTGIMALTANYSFAITAKEIIEKAYTSQIHKYEFVKANMTLFGKNNQVKETRTFVSYTENLPNSYQYIQVFLDPRGMRGTTNLTIKKDGKTNRWIYLPHLNKETVQRVGDSNSQRKQKILGSDLINEDVEQFEDDQPVVQPVKKQTTDTKSSQNKTTNVKYQPVRNYEYKYNKQLEEKYSAKGQEMYVIDVIPISTKAKEGSSYSKRRYHITKETFLLRRLDYFDKTGKHSKYQLFRDYYKTSLGSYKPKVNLIVTLDPNSNFLSQSATKLEIISQHYSDSKPKGWDDNIFTFRSILDQRLVANGGEILK